MPQLAEFSGTMLSLLQNRTRGNSVALLHQDDTQPYQRSDPLGTVLLIAGGIKKQFQFGSTLAEVTSEGAVRRDSATHL